MLCQCSDVCFFFFFFQAEDGIRDLTVTGVQTCALPISASSRYCVVSRTVVPPSTSSRIVRHSSLRLCRSRPVVGSSRKSTGGRETRSEERRVGKECRSRWSPDH